MDYEDLRALQRRERNTQKLAEFSADFYEKLTGLIQSSKTKYQQSNNTCDFKNLDNIYKIAKDIFERREQKIILKALRDYRISENDTTNLLNKEKTFYNHLLTQLKEHRKTTDLALLGQNMAVNLSEKPAEISSEDLNSVLIRIINQVPKIMTKDLKEIGPFEPKELIKLPEDEAQLLLSKNLAERV